MNNNYNNLYGDYIGATGIFSISDYIDYTSNILEINSSNYTDTNIINLDNKYNKLIKEEPEGLINHTYITNSNLGGEIRFYNKKPALLNRPDNSVIINNAGYLEIYYNYNALINLLEQSGYKNIIFEIMSSKASINLQGGFIGTLQLETAGIIGYLIKNRPQNEIGELLEAPVFNTTSSITAITSGLNNIATRLQNFLFNNRYTLFLGTPVAGAIFSFAQYGASVDASHIIANAIINQYDSNTTITEQERRDLLTLGSNLYKDKVYDALNNLSNLNIQFGFINSNIQTIQSIPYLLSSNLYASNLSSLNISTSNLYASNLSSLNISTSNLYASNLSSLNISTSNLYSSNLSSLNISTSNLSSFNLYTSNLYVNSANINGIDINNLKTSGNIIENGSILSSKYLTSNHIYNMTQTYTTERQYPPKLYNNKQLEDNKELIGQLRYHTNLYLNDEAIVYGSGYYEIYSSSTYELSTSSKDYLFNYNTNDTTPRARWGAYQYSSISGEYIGNDNINGYYGDWVIIKLPTEISLSRYRIYQFTDTPTKAPSLWKVFGSIDGVAFTEITTASQTTRLSSYTNSYHERIIPGTTPLYSYIGFIFNSLLSTSGQTELSFAELQLFGKEVIINAITSQIYTTSNVVKGIVEFEMPIVAKHYGFYITINTPININGTTYYKYDIDLRKYTQLGIIQIGPQTGDTFRSFKIRVMYATMFFSYIIKDLPNVCYYEVFMSYKNTAIPPNFVAGLNACAIGYPPNTTLQTIMPNNLFVVKNGMGSIDYITVISTNPADCRVIIEDMIG